MSEDVSSSRVTTTQMYEVLTQFRVEQNQRLDKIEELIAEVRREYVPRPELNALLEVLSRDLGSVHKELDDVWKALELKASCEEVKEVKGVVGKYVFWGFTAVAGVGLSVLTYLTINHIVP